MSKQLTISAVASVLALAALTVSVFAPSSSAPSAPIALPFGDTVILTDLAR